MTDEFDYAAAQVAGNDDPIDKAAGQVVQGQRTQLRGTLYNALLTDPEVAARAQRLGRKAGLPSDLVERNLPQVQRNTQLDEFDALLTNNPVVAEWLADQNNAKIAHDDVENLSAWERAFREARAAGNASQGKIDGQPYRNSGTVSTVERSFLGGITEPVQRGVASGRKRMTELLASMGLVAGNDADLAVRLEHERRLAERFPVPEDIAAGMQEISGAQTMGAAAKAAITNPRAVLETTLESLGASLPSLAGSAAGGSVFGPGGTAAGAGLGSFAVEYAATLDEVLRESIGDKTDPFAIVDAMNNPDIMAAAREKALKRGVPIALFDALTAGLAGKLLAGAKATPLSVGSRAAGELGLQAGGGAAGEATAQAATGEYRPGEILLEALAELPTAGIEVPANYRNALARAQQAEQQTALVENLNNLAKASRLAQRDPETFQAFVAKAAEEGPVQAVYIDGKTLMQSEVAEQIMRDSPAVAAQLVNAAATGGQVAIPVEEYAARIATQDYAQGLLDHLKTDSEGFSRAEAQQYMRDYSVELQAEVERTLTEKQGDDGFKQSAEAVKGSIKAQLDTAARFTPQVNEAYSSMVGNFYAVTAAKLGITPEELYQRYPLKVGAERVVGQQFDQGREATNTAEFRNWFGDSKAVDAEGRPLVMYHGTAGDFEAFDPEKSRSDGTVGKATYLTSSPQYAEEFARGAFGAQGAPSIVPLYANARNILDLADLVTDKDVSAMKEAGALSDAFQVDAPITHGQLFDFLAQREGSRDAAMEIYRSLGYDGVRFTKFGGGQDTLAVFAPEQVKSAVGNQGAFDPNDPNILHQSAKVDDQIEQWAKGDLKPGDSIFVGTPSSILRSFGMPDLPIRLTQSVLTKATHGKHRIETGELRGLAAAIQNPIAVFASKKGNDSLVVLTELRHADGSIIAAIAADKQHDEIRVNDIRSVHPKSDHKVLNWIEDGLLLGYEKTKGREWLDRTAGSNSQRGQVTAALTKSRVYEVGAESKPGGVYNQGGKKRDDYTLDLFGVPDPAGTDTPAERPAAGRQEGQLSRDDAPGVYAARTELVEENTRELGTDKVTTPEEAAQALAYLGKGAVERFDALVTDNEGKPLAIVGAFKGALTQASVFPATVVSEAFRLQGAANIWFAHNHPSGVDELSSADRNLHTAMTEAFKGSGITARGLFAIAGKEGSGRKWVYEPTPDGPYNRGADVRGVTTAPSSKVSVPVVERVYSEEGRLGPAISSPGEAKRVAKSIAGDQSGVLLMTAQNEPVAFIPVDPTEAGHLRRDGRMDTLYRALSVANAGAAIVVNNGNLGDQVVRNLAGLFNSLDARVLDVMEPSQDGGLSSWAEVGKSFGDRSFNQTARGAFNPETLQITLLKNADLSTFLHESGHFFLEVQFDLAARLLQEAEVFGRENMKPGERQMLEDAEALLKWFDVPDLPTWFNLDFEEKRAYHEQFARGFEAYLFEGKAPSIELQGLFQRFRAWLLNVYKQLKALNVELTDEVRSVMDRMLASTEQIQLAEQARSMMPLFTSPDQAGMTVDEFAAYQALGVDATNEAIQDLQARGLRDMQWLHNARGREIKKLQKQAREARAAVQMDVRREVMSQPVYRAWAFLTGKISAEDKIEPVEPPKSNPDVVDPAQDSLFKAIGKLGGVRKDQVLSEWGIDPKDVPQSGVFGKPVWRREDGLPLDTMATLLAQHGYLPENYDLNDFYDRFAAELAGDTQYSNAYAYEEAPPAGLGVFNPGGLNAARLDLDALAESAAPAEVINVLKARRMTDKVGLHPDTVAEMFGFTSGDELARKLAEATPPNEEIEALTDVRMLEQYGELSSPEAIEKAADRAIHNDVRARMVATEANALAKAVGKSERVGTDSRGRAVMRPILPRAAREFARAMIARLKVRDIRPGQYANAEVRAAKAAEKASKSGNLAEAAAEKRNQLINLYAAREAHDAQEEVDSGLRYLKKFDSDAVRKGLDADYTDQIDALLERFDLRRQSLKAIDKRAALAEWIKAQREAGLEPDIPAELENEAFRKSYRDLTVEEFRGLVDTVRQIEHLGRLKHKLLTAKDQRAYEAVRDEIVASVNENAQNRSADTRTPTTNMGRTVAGLKRFWASHIKAATWARVMDGGKDGGPMWEYFVRGANERGDMETTMRAEATAKLSEILAPVFKLGRMGGKGQFFPSINRSLNREARIALALNAGNAGNLQRLLDGEGWTLQQAMPVMQSLTAQEWRVVQAVWDHFETYRPLIAAKERRIYGKEPVWIEPQPLTLTTADGETITLRGGYYPIKYDPAASQRAEEHADAEDARRQLQGAYTTATTRRSFTKARAEEVKGRPLLYTLAGMYSGVNDVIHDLAWHEWLIDTNRLLRSHGIDQAIREHYGPEAKQQFKTWVRDIAEGERGADAAVDIALSRLRQGISAAGLGFNVMTAMIQPLGLTQSITRVGAPWIARGMTRYLAHPVELTREVNALSSFMENRARTRFRELNELRNKVQDQTVFKEVVGTYAYWLMMRAQQMVDVPTWWGAYEKALAAGNEEERAIALADQAVIDSQGGGMTKDLSAIERGGPAQRLFTVFYNFMNTAFNLGVAQTMSPHSRAKLAVDYAMLYVVPAVLSYFLKEALTPGDDGDDDWESLARKLAAAQIDYLMGLMVVVREFSEAAQQITGANDFGRDYTGPAGLRLIADTVKLGKQAAQGEFDDAFRKAAVNVVGDLFGLPSAQINRTITGAQALAEDETDNPAALAFGFRQNR